MTKVSLQFRIEELDKSTIKEQVSLYNRVFEQKWSVEEWEYINYQNPLTCTPSGGNVIGAFHGDKLIGLLTSMDMRYTYKGVIYHALQIGNISVHIDYRHQGILTSLVHYAENIYKSKGYDFLVVFPNRNSYPAFCKMRWLETKETRWLIENLNTNNIIERVFGFRLPKPLNIISGLLSIKSKVTGMRSSEFIIERTQSPPFGLFKDANQNQEYMSMVLEPESATWIFKDPAYLHYVVKDGGGKQIAYYCVHEHPFVSVIGSKAEIVASYYLINDIRVLRKSYCFFIRELRKTFDILLEWNSLNSKREKQIRKSAGYFDVHLRKPHLVKILSDDAEKIATLSDKTIWNPKEIDMNTTVHYVDDA